MNKKEILSELDSKFEELKKEIELNVSLEDIDEIFYIKDVVLKDGFVSDALSRQICSRISETYGSWANYLHNLLLPVPGHMLYGTEAKAINEDDKKVIWKILKESMELSSRNNVIGITKDRKAESKFIKDAIDFWNVEFKVKIGAIMQKINENWNKK